MERKVYESPDTKKKNNHLCGNPMIEHSRVSVSYLQLFNVILKDSSKSLYQSQYTVYAYVGVWLVTASISYI